MQPHFEWHNLQSLVKIYVHKHILDIFNLEFFTLKSK